MIPLCTREPRMALRGTMTCSGPRTSRNIEPGSNTKKTQRERLFRRCSRSCLCLRPRRLWPFSRKNPKSFTQEDTEEMDDRVEDTTPLIRVQVHHDAHKSHSSLEECQLLMAHENAKVSAMELQQEASPLSIQREDLETTEAKAEAKEDQGSAPATAVLPALSPAPAPAPVPERATPDHLEPPPAPALESTLELQPTSSPAGATTKLASHQSPPAVLEAALELDKVSTPGPDTELDVTRALAPESPSQVDRDDELEPVQAPDPAPTSQLQTCLEEEMEPSFPSPVRASLFLSSVFFFVFYILYDLVYFSC
nr:mucin-7-like isoform X2 [Dasypus novemcinctus]